MHNLHLHTYIYMQYMYTHTYTQFKMYSIQVRNIKCDPLCETQLK